MRLEFEITMDDLFEFNLHHARHSPEMKKVIWRVSWGIGLSLSLLGAVIAMYTRDIWHMVLICGAGMLYVALYFAFFKRSFRKNVDRLYSEGKVNTVLGPKSLQIEGDTLLSTSEASETRFKLASLQQIVETEQHAFIYTGPMMAIIVPLARCTSGSPSEFIVQLRLKIPSEPSTPQVG